MTPVLLAIIGTVFASYASLGAALKSTANTRRLAHLSLTLPLVSLAIWTYQASASSLGLLAYSLHQEQALSLTFQYDRPEQGLSVLESHLYLAHPYQDLILGALIILSVLTVGSVLLQKSSEKQKLLTVLSGLWVGLWAVWLFSHTVLPLAENSGELGVRQFLKQSAFDWQRVTQFIVPEHTWYYSNSLWPLVSLSILSALYLIYSSLGRNRKEVGVLNQYLFHIGAILCVASTLWYSTTLGFSGSSTELILWLSALLVGGASATCLPNIQRGTIAMLASLALASTLL